MQYLTIHKKPFQIDEADLALVSQYRWSHDPKGYVRATKYGPTILLHRLLIPTVPAGHCVDHINRDKSDNRRENLRIVTKHFNNLNHSGHSHTLPGGFPGVQFHKATNKWRAYIYQHKKQIHLGLFSTQAQAIEARVKALQLEGVL